MSTPPTIPQTSPGAAYLQRKAQIDAAVSRVLDSGWYILGKELAAFEQQFASYLGVDHAMGVANGTDAIELALRALSVGQGDAVLTVSHTAVATVSAIERTGATPVLVDIDPAHYTMSPDHLQATIAKHKQAAKTALKAIVPVHIYGQMAAMNDILAIANQHNLRVVEDCAQAHGASQHGKGAGTLGDLASFSFYPTKNLGALGDGGAVATSQAPLAQRVRILREYGWEQRYISKESGINSRLDEIQAAILAVRLAVLDEDNQKRIDIAAAYNKQLAGVEGLNLPAVAQGNRHVYHQYVIETEHRDELRQFMTQQGVMTAIHYPMPIHLQPAYLGCLGEHGSLPATEAASSRILSLPMFPQMEAGQVQRVIDVITQWAHQLGKKA